jgi:hypothetical protein
VNELDDGNPSKLLIAAIRKYGIKEKGSFKDDNFYLGAFRGDKVGIIGFGVLLTTMLTSVQLSQVYHIISGDPSRGTIALESHAAPAEGTTVQVSFFLELYIS